MKFFTAEKGTTQYYHLIGGLVPCNLLGVKIKMFGFYSTRVENSKQSPQIKI